MRLGVAAFFVLLVVPFCSGSAWAADAQAAANSQSANTGQPQSGDLEEVIVTAQKVQQRVLDVPVPVSVIDAQDLVTSNELRLQDYYSEIPGLTLTTNLFATEDLSIRGISSLIGGRAPTVGIMVDDLPFGGSGSAGWIVPDVDPGDLQRVEVLRGPQGTLYGADSMGGLIKYVTLDPSTSGFSGRLQAGASNVYNGTEGYNVRASANIPLGDSLAIRVSGFTSETPGYIDNVETGQNGINVLHSSGAHLAALWRMSDNWTLKLSSFLQETTSPGVNDVDLLPNLGDLQQSRVRGSGYMDYKIQNHSLTLEGHLGSVDFKSISGYSITRAQTTIDYTQALGFLSEQYYNVAGSVVPVLDTTDKFSQEFRFSGSVGHTDWLAGLFYTHEYTGDQDGVVAEDPVTGAQVGGESILHENLPSKYSEYAAFVNFTYHVTDRFDVQVGGRGSRSMTGASQVDSGLLVSFVTPEGDATLNAFTYLFTPEFKLTPDAMVYARLASGYRAGGFNSGSVDAAVLGIPVPASYAPDKTYNYELGFKGEFLDHKLTLDTSLYYIDWKDIQLGVSEDVNGASFGYTTNAGEAKSEGIEVAVVARPLHGLSISGWVVYDDQVLTEAFPPTANTVGADGDRLPFSTRYSGNLSVQQDFGLWNGATGFVGGTLTYLGNRLGGFQSSEQRQYYPPYGKSDLRAGVRYDSWTFTAYATNVADKRGLISGGLDYYPPSYAAIYIQPRVIGLNVTKTFQ